MDYQVIISKPALGDLEGIARFIAQSVHGTLQLPQDLRAELVERILLGAHGGVEAAWKQESRRRIAEIQRGKAKGIPLEEALAEARKIAGL
jgi:putative addiction module component (TIGR02574 family)